MNTEKAKALGIQRGRFVAQAFYEEWEKIAKVPGFDMQDIFRLRGEVLRAQKGAAAATANPFRAIRREAFGKQVELAKTEKDMFARAKVSWRRYQKDPEAYRAQMEEDNLPHPKVLEQVLEELGGSVFTKRTLPFRGTGVNMTPPAKVQVVKTPKVPDPVRPDPKKEGPGLVGTAGTALKVIGGGVVAGGAGYAGLKGYERYTKPKDPYAGQY